VTRVSQARIKGLYAITPDMADTEKLGELVEASLQGGASLIQYRNKSASMALCLEQAQVLQELCQTYNTPLIINDHIEICLRLDTDGVHLGIEDIDLHGTLAQARRQLGDRILGVSCYNRFELAQQAKKQGADYIAFGACFKSGTKPAAVNAPLQLISRAHEELGLPVVAIGGITLDNAALAIDAGASSIAVIDALFSADGVQLAAQQFTQLFAHRHDPSPTF
jgi:thiamine-phosphate pyrophosphorylase